MRSLPDSELLLRFAERDDQTAFSEVVARHLNLVYSTAVRQLAGDTHLAQDVAQTVFTDLARKARALAAHRVLAGWLYLSTCYAAAKVVRAEQRRKNREETAQAMHDLTQPSAHDAEWHRLRPALDGALRDLKAQDRDALLLRFFEGRAFSEIGARLRLTENTARMRVDRALEKLRVHLSRKGITSTAAALSGALASHAVTAAPPGLAVSVSAAALSSAGAGGGFLLLQWLGLNKVAAVSTLALLSTAAIGMRVEEIRQARAAEERGQLMQAQKNVAQLRGEVSALTQSATEIATLHQDDAELERLKQQASELRAQLQTIASENAGGSSSSPTSRPEGAKHIYGISELDYVPKFKSQSPPKFPIELRNAGVSGEVVLTFVVEADGKVSAPQVVRSSHVAFEVAALQAVGTWTFSPGVRKGTPVPTQMVVPIVFQLQSQDPKWF